MRHIAVRRVENDLVIRFSFLLSVSALVSAFSALAQPVPKITSLSVEWIQRGTTEEVVFTGENLGTVTGFIFSGDPGLTATHLLPAAAPKPAITIESNLGGISVAEPAPMKDEKELTAKIAATPEAALGAREVRLVTPTGVSNPLLINVGHLPEIREKGPNNSLEQAQMITFPVAISGSINAAAQVDHFRFKASKGQELIFDVDAARGGSALDSSIAIVSSTGKELARNEDHDGLDSLIIFTVPEDGEYILQVRDFRYQGGGNYTYRVYAGALPYVESIFPFGGQRGKQVEVALSGRNLEGTTKMSLKVSPTAPRGRQEIRANTPRGYSNLVPFDVQDLPDFLETEPNNTTDKVNTVSIPVAINGKIKEPKDIDRFKFKSSKDQKLVCEVIAQRFGSPLDALLVLTDADGTVLQQNDDAMGAADARIEFDAKKDTEYLLALRDLTQRGGENFTYRLLVRPPSAGPEAGFTARFSPDAVRVHRGSHAKIRCEVARVAGFEGPVRFSFQDLPPGVFSEPLVLSSAPASGLMLISASKDASLGNFPIKLSATGIAGEKSITRAADPLADDKPVREAFLTVLEPPPFTLELVTLSASIEQNQTATVEVLAQRREDFPNEIKLSAEGYSTGKDPISKSLEVSELTLKPNESLGKLTLKARQDSEVGTRTIIIRGVGGLNGQIYTQYTRELPVTITQIPFVVSSTLSRLTVTALPTNAQSAASETATTIKLERRAGFTNEVALSLDGMPAGINVTLDKIPANGGETTLKLVATEKAPVGTNSVTIVGTGLHNDRNYKHRSGTISVVISAPESTEVERRPQRPAELSNLP
jgi:hypothetical protein